MQKPLGAFLVGCQKLWPFVSTHVRAFATFSHNVIDLSRTDFIVSTAYLLRNSGFFPTFAIFLGHPRCKNLRNVFFVSLARVTVRFLYYGFIALLFPLCYVIREFHRFLRRGLAHFPSFHIIEFNNSFNK